jgi:NAD(P)-dependent dehydrogenase (short-subunit alcohol dehydrogenase family)
MARLEGKRMVITGSTRSLGREFARACAAQGASLVINGTDEDTLEQLRAQFAAAGVRVAAVAGSVARTDVCDQLVHTCVEAFGGIDVLVNNAGIVRDRTLLKMTDEEFDEVIAVDLRGPFLCTRAAARVMKDQGGGHIIHVTSASGLVGNFGQTNYAAAKAGLMGMMYTAVQELQGYGIRSNAMWPIARTDMTIPIIEKSGKTAAELGFGEPQDVAQALVWLASDAAQDWNGQCLTFNGRKVALWHSPREDHILTSENVISIDDIDAHFADKQPVEIYSTRG